MKPTLTAMLFGISVMMMSCKFTATPEGIYTGTYDAYGLPSTSGDGTLYIEPIGGDLYNVTLNTTGNPDIFFSNVKLSRQGTLYGNYYEDGNYSVADTSYSITIYESDYADRSKWSVQFDYEEHPTYHDLNFKGNRIN